MTKLVFEESAAPCYKKGGAYETKEYRVVHYDVTLRGSTYHTTPHWAAYKRIDGLKGRPFGNHVDPNQKEYKTRKQAEAVCIANAKQCS